MSGSHSTCMLPATVSTIQTDRYKVVYRWYFTSYLVLSLPFSRLVEAIRRCALFPCYSGVRKKQSGEPRGGGYIRMLPIIVDKTQSKQMCMYYC